MVAHAHRCHCHPAGYIGRVGALAVALGVGGAVLGFAGAASADGDAPDTANQQTGAGRASAERTADRRSAPTLQPGAAAATRGEGAGHRVATQENTPGDRRAAAENQTARGRDAVSLPEAPDTRSFDISTRILPTLPTTLAGNAPTVLGGPASPAIAAEPNATVALTPEASSAVATAAAAPDVAAGGGDPLTLLGGGEGDAPLLAPLAWATLAAARREEVAGPTPEVAPAATVSAAEVVDQSVGVAQMSISSITGPGGTANVGAVGDTVTISGTNFTGVPAATYTVNQVKFGCSSNTGSCNDGIAGTIIKVESGQITVQVPEYAANGYIRVAKTLGAGANPVFSQSLFTVAGAPTIASFAPMEISVGSPVVITGTNFADVKSVKFNGLASQFTTDSPTQITATVPDNVTSGAIQVSEPNGSVTSADSYTVAVTPLPPLPTCTTGNCSLLVTPVLGQNPRLIVINQVSDAVAAAIPSTGPSLKCTKEGCPIPPGQTTASVANTIGLYGFNLIYVLSGEDGKPGQPDDALIGQQLTNLVTQPNLLDFISDSVAGNAALSALPPAVATTVGNAVATFVDQAFGNPTVATALAPFLKTLGVPATDAEGAALITTLTTGGTITQYLLENFKTTEGQQALYAFFTDPEVQSGLGSALSDSVDVLLGSSAVSSYIGQLAAAAVLGPDNPFTPGLGATIGGAVGTLFSSIGPVVATQAGNALGTLLQQPEMDGQPAVATTLANAIVNTLVGALGGGILPFPDVTLLPALAPGADIAVTGFVDAVLSDTGVQQALGTFVSQVTTGSLANPGVQQSISQQVAGAVSALLGGGSLGQAVGEDVGAAVVALVSNPTVSGAVVQLVNSVVGGVLGAPGVVTAVADAAGGVTAAVMTGTTLATALDDARKALAENPAVDAAVGPSVTAAVAAFLGNTAVWQVVDAGISSLVTELLADPTVQQALSDRVANEVNSFLGLGPISVVGDDVGAAVVALLADPVVSGALVDLVDTVVSDFISAPGVITALSQAAGQLATAALEGNLDSVLPEVGKALRANPDVDAAVQLSVGAAVAQFLGDTELWSTVDAGVTALLAELITDPVVQSALTDRIADEVSTQLGGGDLGTVVGAQVAATVVGLLTDPVIGGALLGVVDTVFSDLFGSPGVIDAFSTAAGDLALAALTLQGQDFDEARAGIIAGLRNNPDVDAGVQFAVEDAVADFLNNNYVWSTVDAAAATLLGELLGDTVVQEALTDRIATEVNTRLGFGPISVVGDQVGAFVVGLLTDPIVTDALVDIVDTAFTNFIYSDGVVDALSGAAGDIALAVLTGESVSAAVQDSLSALRANTDIQAAVRTTVSDALGVIDTQVLSNPTFQEDLGTDVTALIIELAADQPVQALVTDLYGPAIGGLLTNTAVVDDVATAIGTAITELLGYTGVSTAVTDAADQFILAVLGGTDAGTAAQDALTTLQSDPSVVAAVNAVVPPILNGLLDTAEVREAIGVVVQEVTLARLEAMRFNIPFLDRIIAQVAKGTVEDFLTRRAGQDLIDTLAVDLLLGMPASEVSDVVTREIVRDPLLQIALGFSIGQGIGTLFADNIIGDVIGWLAGFPATIVVGIGAAVIGFYQWLVDGWMLLMDALTAPAQPSAVLDLKAGIA